ncbi:MAG: inorganic phosphate transporter [Candidatus Mcinerneyibacterium aminivorans]|uniref:Phosphate transporter n=1 Tax=Candidatus Mcinerneyibacterium aminivorans TaxID=2703815 RepID=A0A5D0MHV1_9BACT|nr:MAG: inorganic phosphate transporter [Candidatus Mcinerneyibacterium aminivorans]
MNSYSLVTILFFLSSGLFLGWSLGANDAANVFGTAVTTKMLKFKTAAIIASIFVIIGAVSGGKGTSSTLEKLGSVNALGGAFIVAFAAAISVYLMTNISIPVSTSQSIVGAIIGWNFFVGLKTDLTVVTKIVMSWIASPILAAIFSIIFFLGIRKLLHNSNIHLIRKDFYTRIGLIVVGAFGAYSLGANNIANVMGVFTETIPLENISLFNVFIIDSKQQLFFIGAMAISTGILTYSKNVMNTVGKKLFKLSPMTALIVVLSSSTVLFLFASRGLKSFLNSYGLPSLPLVPVSSSQAVVGAVLGISIAKKASNLSFKTLGKISLGWVTTPLISALICFIMLFFMQNVFMQKVYSRNIQNRVSINRVEASEYINKGDNYDR